ncbi:MAG: HAMP domain-containing histidine kinase [Oscillospiraceae bacterium]|nr:HAMP domain-containing histidine kinase [Oscillospiraceae bacterium]MDE6005364.1 HAMP domain-containing histidine kinase [Oscillospiraceae bacterium]
MKLLENNKSSAISQNYFRLSGILMLLGILLTGVIMACSAIASYQDTISNAICQNCVALVTNISEIYQRPKDMLSLDVTRLIQIAESEYNYRIWICDEDGEVLYPSGDKTEILTPAIRAYLRTDDFIQIGYYTPEATSAQFCCAIRFYLEDQNRNVAQYYLASVSDAGMVQDYSSMLVRNLVLCLLIAIILFMILFKIGAKRLDSQLDEIMKITEKYAEGEFSERVELPEHANLYALGCTMNRMAEFIEQNESTRKNFIANVSHELRTPMTTIGGFADGILDGTIPESQHKKYIHIIADEIHRLKTLVNSMLNLTKFETGAMQIHLQTVDISKLLIKTVLMFEKRISDKHVDVEGLDDSALFAKADEDLLFQVLYNLIENAVKFVNPNGVISFGLYTEDNIAHICVKNTGEGLADNELPKVFDRFYKTDASRSEDKTGLGLGLSISRKIVHLHQGHIVVKSVKGEYTCFEVQIPVGNV